MLSVPGSSLVGAALILAGLASLLYDTAIHTRQNSQSSTRHGHAQRAEEEINGEEVVVEREEEEGEEGAEGGAEGL